MALEKEDSKNRKATKNDAQVFSSVYTRITCSGRKNILRYIPYEISNTIRMKRLISWHISFGWINKEILISDSNLVY